MIAKRSCDSLAPNSASSFGVTQGARAVFYCGRELALHPMQMVISIELEFCHMCNSDHEASLANDLECVGRRVDASLL